MNHGQKTAQAARALATELADPALVVLYDHGKQGVDPPDSLGKIVSWFGSHLGRDTQLGQLDIAVVRRDTCEAIALIEVEESGDVPKLLLGDLLATLLGDRISFQGELLQVGSETTLIVLTEEGSEDKRRQMAELVRRVRALQPAFTSGNAAIGRVVLEAYEHGALQQTVRRLVQEALDRSGA